jgi:hypothetical protein
MSDAAPGRSSADRNLLFGILALQMDFITRDGLIAAMHACVLDKAKPLGQIMFERGLFVLRIATCWMCSFPDIWKCTATMSRRALPPSVYPRPCARNCMLGVAYAGAERIAWINCLWPRFDEHPDAGRWARVFMEAIYGSHVEAGHAQPQIACEGRMYRSATSSSPPVSSVPMRATPRSPGSP